MNNIDSAAKLRNDLKNKLRNKLHFKKTERTSQICRNNMKEKLENKLNETRHQKRDPKVQKIRQNYKKQLNHLNMIEEKQELEALNKTIPEYD